MKLPTYCLIALSGLAAIGCGLVAAASPTPAVPTGTPAPTATQSGGLPDLSVDAFGGDWWPPPVCTPAGATPDATERPYTVCVENLSSVAAGAFTIKIGDRITVPESGLAGGQKVCIESPVNGRDIEPEDQVIVDPDNQVLESSETNNTAGFAVGTQAPPCTPVPGGLVNELPQPHIELSVSDTAPHVGGQLTVTGRSVNIGLEMFSIGLTSGGVYTVSFENKPGQTTPDPLLELVSLDGHNGGVTAVFKAIKAGKTSVNISASGEVGVLSLGTPVLTWGNAGSESVEITIGE